MSQKLKTIQELKNNVWQNTKYKNKITQMNLSFNNPN